MINSKNCPNQICDYWLITPNQQTLCIETNIFQQRAFTNQRARNYKTASNYKITHLTVQSRLQSIVWLLRLLVSLWPLMHSATITTLSSECCILIFDMALQTANQGNLFERSDSWKKRIISFTLFYFWHIGEYWNAQSENMLYKSSLVIANNLGVSALLI